MIGLNSNKTNVKYALFLGLLALGAVYVAGGSDCMEIIPEGGALRVGKEVIFGSKENPIYALLGRKIIKGYTLFCEYSAGAAVSSYFFYGFSLLKDVCKTNAENGSVCIQDFKACFESAIEKGVRIFKENGKQLLPYVIKNKDLYHCN